MRSEPAGWYHPALVTSPPNAPASIEQRLLSGDKGALARLITWAENADPRFGDAMRALHSRVGRAWRVGVTGPPGAGKSTLVNELARFERATSKTVGILAVDPSSPFTGGALLGDRIRMEERTNDPGVYIRSMASRGSHGGLSRTAVDACDAMDAFGLDLVVLETVGVGQAEYDIVAATDTVLVVLCPGAGDGIQAMKAGILEVADVLVVNKADLAGADRLVLDLEEAVHLRETVTKRPAGAWHVPVVAVSAGKGEHLDRLAAEIAAHRRWLETGVANETVCSTERAASERAEAAHHGGRGARSTSAAASRSDARGETGVGSAGSASPASASTGSSSAPTGSNVLPTGPNAASTAVGAGAPTRRLAAVRREKRLAHVRRVVEERLDEALWTRGGLAEQAGTLLDAGRAPYDVVETLVAAILAGEVLSKSPRGTKSP